jgi:drug/metabolite transporter (DMT)-like permease
MLKNIFLLIFATAIWGFGFVAAKWTFVSFDPYWSTAIRYIFASILGLPYLIIRKSFTKKNNNLVLKSIISSIFLLGLLLFQTLGLNYTTVAKSGFITTLYALFVPLILMIFSHKKYRSTFWLLLILALFGVSMMCNLEIKGVNGGDFLTLLCSLSAAFHIIYIGKIANSIESAFEFNFLQNFFVAIFSTIIAFIFQSKFELSSFLSFNSLSFWGMAFLSIISSLLAYSIQIHTQKKIPPHIAGLIFLSESPFAALFGYLFLNEKLSLMNLFGAFCILLSVILVPILGREVTTTQRK